MNKTIRNVVIALALSAVPTLASAQWQNATATYKTDNTSTVKLQRGTKNAYGFLNLYGDKNFDFESMYGEARVRKSFGKGFAVGAEYNGGIGVRDILRPQVSYTKQVGPIFLDAKFSPIETSRKLGSQLGIYASTNYKALGLEGWVDLDYKSGKITPSGELEGSFKIAKDLSVVVRGEKYPWQNPPEFSTGIKLNL
ncbi:MAG: hypothetical protein AABW51_04700 [Nanoarchaeota archaeon]